MGRWLLIPLKFFAAIWLLASVCAAGLAQGQEPAAQDEFFLLDEDPSTQAAVEPERAPRSPFGGPGSAGGMGGPGMSSPGYKATWYPSRPGFNTGTDIGVFRQNLSGAVPVWREDGEIVLLSGGIRNNLFFTDAILPDTQRPFPYELWNISLGLMYLRQFDNDWSGGISTTFGSASDKPFHSIHEMNVSLFTFLQVPAQNERDAWLFSLMYSPVGNLTFPIPGVAYSWKPSDELQMNIGIPFTVNWAPTEALTFNFSYLPITNVTARATYALTPVCSIYGGFEWLYEAYFLADRADTQDRFMGFEKRLIGGLRWDLGPYTALDVNAGYAFDRYYGEGDDQIGNLHDRVDIGAGAFLGASLLIRR